MGSVVGHSSNPPLPAEVREFARFQWIPTLLHVVVGVGVGTGMSPRHEILVCGCRNLAKNWPDIPMLSHRGTVR